MLCITVMPVYRNSDKSLNAMVSLNTFSLELKINYYFLAHGETAL